VDGRGAEPLGDADSARPAEEEISGGVAVAEADAALQAPDDSALPDPEADDEEVPEIDENGDVVESKPRRRGRRGGRRRSRARVEDADVTEISTSTDTSD
jgi:hypothetical protein